LAFPTTLTAKEELSAMTIYLYKKTHNKTGLNYLGKTTNSNPHKYKGSGDYWSKHIKKHGYDVTTIILKECKTNEEVKEWGLYYSELWNVVGSKDWANLKPEQGAGGGDGFSSTDATLNNLKRIAKGDHPFVGDRNPVYSRITEGTHNFQGDGSFQRNVALSRVKEGTHPLLGAKSNKARLENGTHPSQIKNTCEHCGATASLGMFKRWHGDNCRKK
jgi:transposase